MNTGARVILAPISRSSKSSEADWSAEGYQKVLKRALLEVTERTRGWVKKPRLTGKLFEEITVFIKVLAESVFEKSEHRETQIKKST